MAFYNSFPVFQSYTPLLGKSALLYFENLILCWYFSMGRFIYNYNLNGVNILLNIY